MTDSVYVTTAIPYVNAEPHLGFATELVLADAVARHHRQQGAAVRFQTGADENSLKNVRAAEAAGETVSSFVARHAASFEALRQPLRLSSDDFIRTSVDPRHAPAVAKLWRRCAPDDIYRKPYEGLYCVGCEQFYRPQDLVGPSSRAVCPEHGTPPERVEEENYFFRLSRYETKLAQLIESDELRIRPQIYRNEALQIIKAGLHDFSISRSRERAHGWGIEVPGDPSQIIYVWFDALINYISGLDYATEGTAFDEFWRRSKRRIHVLGKGVLRFHAIYWPAILLSAGLPLPTDLFVHSYVTLEGQKISKSSGTTIAPGPLVERYGTDALRYFLVRHIHTGRDGDFSQARLRQVIDGELADQLGNVVRRVIGLVAKYADHRIPAPSGAGPQSSAPQPPSPLQTSAARVFDTIDEALDTFEPHLAVDALWQYLQQINRFIAETAPWTLARSPERRGELRNLLGDLSEAIRIAAVALAPFLPDASATILEQLGYPSLPSSVSRQWAVVGRSHSGSNATTERPVRLGEPLFRKNDSAI